jgi:hypothetical protein
MHPASEDVEPVDRCVVRGHATVAPMGDGTDHDGVDVEPEAERKHQPTVAPPGRREQDGVLARYASGEEGEVMAAGSR